MHRKSFLFGLVLGVIVALSFIRAVSEVSSYTLVPLGDLQAGDEQETPTHASTSTDTPTPAQTPTVTHTPAVTNTPTITPTPPPTYTPMLTLTPTPLPPSVPTPTLTPSSTPVPAASLVVNRYMNVRKGPGTNYKVVGTVGVGAEFPITGQNRDGSWWQIDYNGEKGWLYAPYVTAANAGGVEVIIAPTPKPTSTPRPTKTPEPIATPLTECTGDDFELLDVSDVSFGATKRFSFDYSLGVGCDEVDAMLYVQLAVILLEEEMDFNALAFHFFCAEPSVSAWPAADVVIHYAPYGDWSRANEVRTGDYRMHEFSLFIAQNTPCQ